MTDTDQQAVALSAWNHAVYETPAFDLMYATCGLPYDQDKAHTAGRYILCWIVRHVGKFIAFHETRRAADNAYAALYNKINAATEGDLANHCNLVGEFPLLLGGCASCALLAGIPLSLDSI